MRGGNDLAFRGSVLPVGRTRDGQTVAAFPEMLVAPANALAGLFGADSGDVRGFMDGGRDDLIGNAAELGMAAGVGSAVAPAPANALRMFGGRNAKTADLAALTRAEQLAASGADRRAIWDETGWFTGADGKWRFEIDDSRSMLRNSRDGLRNAEDAVHHPDLFNAYPSLSDARMRFDSGIPNLAAYRGSNGRGRDQITVGSGFGDQTHNVVLHEMQHGVQAREGFARGASLATAEERAKDVKARLDAANNDFAEANWRYVSTPTDESAKAAALAAMQRRDALERELRWLEGDGTWSPYERMAGEAEARNVERRSGMTADERRATPPWETQDVPDADQIVRFGAGVQESRPGPGLPMDEASRMARAREMGFAVKKPLYHGSPDMRGVNETGGFSPRATNVRVINDLAEFDAASDALRIAGPGSPDYMDALARSNTAQTTKQVASPVFLSPQRGMAQTYADPKRAFDYQGAEPGVMGLVARPGKQLDVDGGGESFRGISERNVRSALENAGIDQAKIEDAIARHGLNIRDGRMRTDALSALAQEFGFDSVAVRNVRDHYNGGGRPGEVVMVFDPARLRKPEAAFDPARANDTDLLAANASALPAAAAAAGRDTMPSGVERFPGGMDHEAEFLRWARENGLMQQPARAFPARGL
jgi:hypothetical protein